MFHKPSLGSCEAPQKSWTQSVQPFLSLSVTSKQKDRWTSKVNKKMKSYVLLDESILFLLFSTLNIFWVRRMVRMVRRMQGTRCTNTTRNLDKLYLKGHNFIDTTFIQQQIRFTKIPIKALTGQEQVSFKKINYF